jgi:hypothetical protein
METRYQISRDATPFDIKGQQAARDAVMQIRLFPDLIVQLRNALGYGPHCDMLQHFVYWMHPRHPKMQKRWTLYKTYAQWRDECGLARKQIDKGRAKLWALGLVTEKKGPHARLHYRVDWVALAEVLSLSPIGEQTDDLDVSFYDFEDDGSLSPYGEQIQSVHQGEQSSMSPYGEQANTGEYTEDYVSGNTLLQSAHGAIKEKDSDGPPVEDKRHSQVGHTPDERAAEKVKPEKPVAPPKPTDTTLLTDVREILDPDSGRWWGARFVADKRSGYKPEKVAYMMLSDPEEDIERPELVMSADRTGLEEAVRYVMWEQGQREVS